MQRPIVIMPTLNPLPNLVDYVKRLIELDITQVIIVNDGSDEKYQRVFDCLSSIKNCKILVHKKNKGKGRALKTGFEYVLHKYPKVNSVITVGAHGQHTIDDVELILHNLGLFSNGIILGVRNFKTKDLSMLYSLGNHVASLLFHILFQRRIQDIQTGLRCIPRKDIPWLLNVPGETFDYDMNMIIEAIRREIPIYEIPIGRVKIKKNSVIHYDEIVNPNSMIHQIIHSFTKQRKSSKSNEN